MHYRASKKYSFLFEKAFSKPELRSSRGKELWLDLEVISDTLAGPMFSVLERGNHDYVYRDRENRFPGVCDPLSFYRWAITVVEKYRETVLRFNAQDTNEKEDRDILLCISNAMFEIIELSAKEVETNKKRKQE